MPICLDRASTPGKASKGERGEASGARCLSLHGRKRVRRLSQAGHGKVDRYLAAFAAKDELVN